MQCYLLSRTRVLKAISRANFKIETKTNRNVKVKKFPFIFGSVSKTYLNIFLGDILEQFFGEKKYFETLFSSICVPF